VAYGIRFLTIALAPLVKLSESISRSLRGDVEVPVTTSEEIRLLALLGRKKGDVGVDTAGLVVGATQLRHMQAHDVMLPREDVCFLSADMSRIEAMETIRKSGHSRFPFSASNDLNDVSGVVLAKDLLYWLLCNEDETIDWPSLTKEALVIPPTVPLLQLLRSYQDNRKHLAVIIDEYGTVEGIVTMEDVLEEIVGDIFDESDAPIRDLHELSDGSMVVRSRIDLRKLSNALKIAWDPDIEATTAGGLVTNELERIPRVGDTVLWQGHRIEVLRADERRATLLRIEKLPAGTAESTVSTEP
jgi:CBS domain containing-hemolysin-like protein